MWLYEIRSWARGTTNAIFIVHQLQEKLLAANKLFCMAFVDLEKAFDRVPRDVIWWAMRKLGIDEWQVRLVQSMYNAVESKAPSTLILTSDVLAAYRCIKTNEGGSG